MHIHRRPVHTPGPGVPVLDPEQLRRIAADLGPEDSDTDDYHDVADLPSRRPDLRPATGATMNPTRAIEITRDLDLTLLVGLALTVVEDLQHPDWLSLSTAAGIFTELTHFRDLPAGVRENMPEAVAARLIPEDSDTAGVVSQITINYGATAFLAPTAGHAVILTLACRIDRHDGQPPTMRHYATADQAQHVINRFGRAVHITREADEHGIRWVATCRTQRGPDGAFTLHALAGNHGIPVHCA